MTMPLDDDAACIKAVLTTPTSCTAATTDRLAGLLNGASSKQRLAATARLDKSGVREQKASTGSCAAGRNTVPTAKEADQVLKPAERVRLATEVVNICLKSLSQEVQLRSRDSAAGSPRKRIDNVLTTRSVNVPPTPNKSAKNGTTISTRDGVNAIADCARDALAFLRRHNDQLKAPSQTILQVESAMSALVSKLIALDMVDLACKEVRILAQRLGMGVIIGSDRKSKKPLEAKPVPEPLVSLLQVSEHPDSTQRLALIISTQLHIVRLLRSIKTIPDARVLCEILKPNSPSSPVALIEIAQAADGKDKCARQLVTLAHAVAAVAERISSKNKGTPDDKFDQAEPILHLRTRSLQILCQSWIMIGHQIDIGSQLCQPFRRYIEDYLSQSVTSANQRLTVVEDSISTLTSLTQSLELSTQQTEQFQAASLDFDRILQSLSKSAGNLKKSKQIADRTLTRVDAAKVSGARKASIICQAAISAVQSADSMSQDEVRQSLQQAISSYSTSVDGTSEELDELLIAISSLRKVVMASIVHHKDRIPTHGHLPEQSVRECVFKTLTFTLRYVGKPLDTDSATAKIRYEKRRSIASKIARPTIESVAALAKQSAKSDDWKEFEQCLEDCLELADRLELDDCNKATDKTKQTPIRLLISNVFWYRYLHLRQSTGNNSTLVRLLERSIHLLADLSTIQQNSGLLVNKLERLAHVYTHSKAWEKSVSVYQQALDHVVKSGSAQAMAQKLCWVPLINAVLEDPEFRIVGKIIEGHAHAQTHLEHSTRSFPSPENTSLMLQGFLLELQLVCWTKQYRADHTHGTAKIAIAILGDKLLQLYTKHDFPIRRLRAVSTLADCDVILEREDETNHGCPDLSSEERTLLPFHDHLIARRNAIFAIRQLQRSKLLKTALDQWHTLVSHKSITNWQALANRIGDIRGWHDLLATVASFSDANDLVEQRAAALDLLRHTLQLSVSFDKPMFMLHTSTLASELIGYGLPDLAFKLLNEGQDTPSATSPAEIGLYQWYIAQAEYCIATKDISGSKAAISAVQRLVDSALPDKTTAAISENLKLKARLHHISSRYQHALGQLSMSTFHIKQSIKYYLQAWAIIERKNAKLGDSNNLTSPNGSEYILDADQDDRSKDFTSICTTPNPGDSTSFWPLVRPLFEALMYASKIHLQAGLVCEGRYYVLEALRVAKSVAAPVLKIKALAFQADIERKCGNHSVGESLSIEAGECLQSLKCVGKTQLAILHAYCVLHCIGKQEDGLQQLDQASELVSAITPPRLLHRGSIVSETEQLIDEMEHLDITSKKTKSSKGTVNKPGRPTIKTTGRSTKPLSMDKYGISFVEQLKADLLLQKARILSRSAANPQSLRTVEDVVLTCESETRTLQQALLSCNINLRRGLETVEIDSVLNIVSEAVLAQPAVMCANVKENTPPARASKKTSAALVRRRQQAQKEQQLHFNDAVACSTSVPMSIADGYSTIDAYGFGEVGMKSRLLLSAMAPTSEQLETSTARLAGQLELGRNFACLTTSSVIAADRMLRDQEKIQELINPSDAGICMDLDRFQSEYVDIIPPEWHVVSMSLNDDRKELRLGAFRSGISPLVLSIPLSRESRDGEENGFTFDQGKKELFRFIDLANYSTHESIDMTKKGAKAEWWEARAALDSRLRDLLMNIENLWLGGFKGLLMDFPQDEDLIHAFERAFVRTLDSHLPSRQLKKGIKTPSVVLNRQLLELFLGLGDPLIDQNIDEPILDLLYFVVDTLWFNGEKNASDEIDFDPMVLEIQAALTNYHEAIKARSDESSSSHTILILDKRLHAFPWESLPCLKGRSVSRLPSLYSLRQQIIKFRAQCSDPDVPGLTVDRSDGAVVLNPSGNLKNTQELFEPLVSRLTTWSSQINSIPKEAEIANALSTKSLYLYLGHGSGGQYIRSRTIRRLDQCAVALLMGCSSSTLAEAGEFESYGTPLHYLHGGSPAVVGTLWDVTDKDIDRFSTKMLERWGLFEPKDIEHQSTASPSKKSTRAKGKQKAKEPQVFDKKGSVGLDAAVAEAREACIMRYLNGAAPIVYGIPVFLR